MTTELDTKSTYGKGVIGRIRVTLDNNILPLAGGQFDGKVAKFQHFASALPPYPFEARSIEVQAARLNVRLPKVLDALILSGSRAVRDEAYIEAMGGEDFGNLSKIAMRTAILEPQGQQTALRVVYGGTTDMSVRALSYLMPALVYMENLEHAGIPLPQLQVIFADHISSSANDHISYEEAVGQSGQFAHLASRYIGDFFPRLKDSVVFLRDTPTNEGSIVGRELSEIAPLVTQAISEETRGLLLTKGNGGNGETNAYYGAAHLLVHDVSLPNMFVPILEDQPEPIDPEAIISIGGRQERLFYRIRHEAKASLPKRYRDILTLQFFTRHQVPPYNLAGDGDVRLTDYLRDPKSLSGSNIGPAARYDISYMFKVSAPRGDLEDFFARNKVE